MKKTFLFVSLLVCCSFAAFSQEPLEQWSHNHPEASKALGDWVHNHPAAAHQMFEWDAQHPDRSQLLVNWAIDHPKEKLNVFLAQHRDWPAMELFTQKHAPAMEDFLLWCRTHGPAARTLMLHSKALAWAGDHLYKTAGGMEHPHK